MTQPYQRGPRASRSAARPGTRPGDRHALKAGKPLDIRDALAERYKGSCRGRALDAIAPRLETMAGTVGARAIGEFGIDVSRLH
ncbi:hypothetical protein [Streptomyces sp. NPDC000880]